MERRQALFIVREDINNVITAKEASQILGISDGYIRRLVLKGEFLDWKYRKTDKALLFNKESVEKRVNK